MDDTTTLPVLLAIDAVQAADVEPERHRWRTLGILSLLMGFASISTDLYLPAMPAMGRSLGADTSTIELTVSGYLVGFSVGQLLWGLAVPLFLFVSATGFIVANSIAGALADFPHRAGAVSALVGAMQYGCGILSSAFVGAFADCTPWPMACVIALMGVGCFLCAWLIVPGTTGPGLGR